MTTKRYGGEYARRAEQAIQAASSVRVAEVYGTNAVAEVQSSAVKISRHIESARIWAQLHHTEVLRDMGVPVPVPETPLQDTPTQFDSPPYGTSDSYEGIGGSGPSQWDR